MKKLHTYLMIALSLIMGFGITANAEISSNQLIVYLNSDDYDIPEESPKGWRAPSKPATCTIDFTTLSITSNRVSSVLSYELWDEEGETSIAAYPSDSELVQFMTGLDGVYQLRLVTDEYIYIGYIEL